MSLSVVVLIFTCELDNKRIKNRHQNNLLERAEFVFVFLELGFAFSQFRQIYVIIIRSWVHPLVNSGFPVTQSLVLCVLCFVDRCLSFCTFSFGHCVVCSYSIYGFWLLLPLWYLQTLFSWVRIHIFKLFSSHVITMQIYSSIF
jgi:hypothetical protein